LKKRVRINKGVGLETVAIVRAICV